MSSSTEIAPRDGCRRSATLSMSLSLSGRALVSRKQAEHRKSDCCDARARRECRRASLPVPEPPCAEAREQRADTRDKPESAEAGSPKLLWSAVGDHPGEDALR